jgi:hypothetical protein
MRLFPLQSDGCHRPTSAKGLIQIKPDRRQGVKCGQDAFSCAGFDPQAL